MTIFHKRGCKVFKSLCAYMADIENTLKTVMDPILHSNSFHP